MSTESSDTLSSAPFDVRELSVRLQKKLAGKLASRSAAKHLVSDPVAALLDAVYRLLKDFHGKREAEKVRSADGAVTRERAKPARAQTVKNVLKLTLKLAVLARNEQLGGEAELRQLDALRLKLRSLAMTVVSFQQLDFSYDRRFLLALLDQTQQALRPLVARLLSDKSLQRLTQVTLPAPRQVT